MIGEDVLALAERAGVTVREDDDRQTLLRRIGHAITLWEELTKDLEGNT